MSVLHEVEIGAVHNVFVHHSIEKLEQSIMYSFITVLFIIPC